MGAPLTSLALLVALPGCAQGHVATLTPHGVLSLDTLELDLGAAALATRAEADLGLRNTGDVSLSISLVLADPDGPFSVSQDTLSLAAGASVDVRIWFEPLQDRALQAGELRVNPDDGALSRVTLTGTAQPDGDGDGHDHPALGGDDCDDTRADVAPSAAEVWYDGVDQDCDGGSDHDADLDGWDQEPVGQDCDDADPAIRPDATEVWYDDVDQDCDGGSDHDADRDGEDATPTGQDCDDSDALVQPGAEEIWYDGVDQDCDGASDLDADQDGEDAEGWGGADCDDGDPDVWPDAPEADDLQDDDCDGLVDEDFLGAGDLVLSELLVDPAATYDHYGQFVELTNVSAREVALTGWTLSSDAGDLALDTDAVVASGSAVVLCIDADAVLNGGLSCDGTWGPQVLDSPDGLTLSAGGLTVDGVAWTPLWPQVEGASMSLEPGSMDASSNDDRTAWCSATSPMGSGDLGTPGSANDACL